MSVPQPPHVSVQEPVVHEDQMPSEGQQEGAVVDVQVVGPGGGSVGTTSLKVVE